MKASIALISLVSVMVCVSAGPSNSLSGLDIKSANGKKSYCTGQGDKRTCTVKAKTTVKIVFTLNVVVTASDLIFTGRIGKSENKKVFENYHACVNKKNVVLQQKDCQSKTLYPGTYTGSIDVVISYTKTSGKLIIGDRTSFKSDFLPVTIE